MFEYIIGTVEYVGPQYIVVENNGIGYQIYTPNPYAFRKGSEREKVYTYLYVREDANILYGFKTREAKMLFEKLLTVSGIGPKGALAVLASADPGQIIRSIEGEDEEFLMKFPGIGKKTARQMILDLKGKFKEFQTEPEGLSVEAGENGERRELKEAILALEALGFTQREIGAVLPELKKAELTAEQYIKLALQKLAK
ncbi:MAG: Holliday junction branch migration protein RuvA [Caldibacillus debilis]|uniref:Holliday junction branch migration complex subunit RuvA n=2 Tax=Caldibacillus debilis TaxID=301148 RepID=A0A420VBZ9_9BACI|nr:Holliday junction branch migration protein RuvA [Caldibacillus debilis]MBO2480850.1 Holliday junction branch migration protein RuvA [Bacillaceae bacterium]MBY6271625.1 Holliday junction branch migration protein RuvA [Bacillaceae bacterium]REJ24345.1 MAG: Holliday junction branch migration protein RuvA [Caldibacillus debilis]REJ26269.1 MAG: Holliday junction branch migration protein RuvA [Caldibacillus debilis]RKO61080.1 Holliday junction DNA helicase subunit RuvA [Caldibacillus debilis GB1]